MTPHAHHRLYGLFLSIKMGTAVLHPQDCLTNHSHHETLIPLYPTKHGRNPNRTPRTATRRKRSPSDSESDRPKRGMVVKSPTKKLVMGQVKILKRGEVEIPKPEPTPNVEIEEKSKLETEEKSKLEIDFFSKDRLGPDPEMIPKAKAIGILYAGSVIDSPSPTSLPMPSVFLRSITKTEGIRQLLRL